MNALRQAACILLAAVLLSASPAYATTFTTDQSDLWYIPSESGWGMQLVQRGSVIFATLFVYGPSGQPTWYTATLNYTANFNWTGTLYATTGDWFEIVPFNPADVTLTNVGTLTWQAQTTTTGTLTYVVNGVTVVKDVIREALVLDDFSGHYAGYAHREFSGCINDGVSEVPRTTDIVQNGTAIAIFESFPTTGNSCTFNGTVSEFGQMGDFEGTFACTDGSSGTESWFEVQVTISGLTNRHAITYSNPAGCQNNGWFGGATVTTF
jgi:hypothetical protein